MKDNIISFFLTILIFIVIACTILLSMDLYGVINLPDKFSLKTYLPNSIEVVGRGEDEKIYYPDYEATGIQDILEKDASVSNDYSGSDDLSSIINSNNNTNSNSSTLSNNVTDNSYYYNLLDTYGNSISSTLYSYLDNLKCGDYTVDFGMTFNELLQSDNGEKVLADAFQLSINALLLDHPEIFYLDVTKMYMYTETTTTIKGTTYKISIGPEGDSKYLAYGFNSKSDVVIAEDKLNTILYLIKSNLSGDVYNQIKQVHNYLIDNINYDSENTSELSHGIYGALVNDLAVCDGYSKAFKYILDNIGISCIEVCGVAENSSGTRESHAWNDVVINGKWYAVDVTWDDPIIIGGNGRLTDTLRYNYFLKGSDTLYSSHTEDGYIVSNRTI